jgi:hypothetical protein
VLAVLQPVWTIKSETAARIRGRMEAVLDAARARGLIDRDHANPARWKAPEPSVAEAPEDIMRRYPMRRSRSS